MVEIWSAVKCKLKYIWLQLTSSCVQCFNAICWASGRASGLQKL